LESWRNSAAIGDNLIYYTGMLINDRVASGFVDQVASDAWSLYMKGRALLTQRRLGVSHYEYWITAHDGPPIVEKML
jgi:hypothetical protein